ncbi:hypothetical protein ACFWJ5_09670 [Streptomyces qaidamensis]|uniref:hypothetical protein n=1 Tax=Streptomyces qaidamensis TaxID=1783515 RepID=UPI00365FCE11
MISLKYNHDLPFVPVALTTSIGRAEAHHVLVPTDDISAAATVYRAILLKS